MKDRTELHLTDDELTEWLDGSAGPAVRTHLDGCAACRREADGLQDGIARYVIATRREAAQAEAARMAEEFAPARATVQLRINHRLRWVGAGVLALLLAAQTVWMMKTHTAPGAAQAAAHPAAVAAPQPAVALNHGGMGNESMSDDELLQAVNNDLSDEVPQALAPVGAITEARNQIASQVERKSETQEVK
jgi:hypothetical protein